MMSSENLPAPHMGQMIESALPFHGLTRSQLARRLGNTSQAVSAIIGQPTLQAAKLWEVCLAMEHDFFADLSDRLPDHIKPSPENAAQRHIASLEQQIRDLQKEVEIYQRALRLKTE